MKKLKNVLLVFDDGTQLSMDAAKEINIDIKTKLFEPLHYDPDKPTQFEILLP